MFNNLSAELTRNGIKIKDFARKINVCEKTINNKISGKTEFTLSEIKVISAMFPDKTLDYLFDTSTRR